MYHGGIGRISDVFIIMMKMMMVMMMMMMMIVVVTTTSTASPPPLTSSSSSSSYYYYDDVDYSSSSYYYYDDNDDVDYYYYDHDYDDDDYDDDIDYYYYYDNDDYYYYCDDDDDVDDYYYDDDNDDDDYYDVDYYYYYYYYYCYCYDPVGRPRQTPKVGKERHLWHILLLLSLCANAFFLLSVHTFWLGPSLQVFVPRSARDLAGGQDDVRAITSQSVSASRNNETKEALLGVKAVAVGKNSSSGVQGVSGEIKRISVVLSKKGGGSELLLRPAEKSALGVNQRALKKNKDPVLLTNRSSSYVTNADLCLPPFWTTNPNATARLEDVMKTVQDFPPEDYAAVQILSLIHI